MKKRLKTWARTLGLGVVLPALGYIVVASLARPARSPTLEELGIDPKTTDISQLPPQVAKKLGLISLMPTRELVAVLISSSRCNANKIDAFRDAISAIPGLVAAQISSDPAALGRFVGVATDTDVRAGTEYLLDLADFDEVVAGGNWLNSATEKYLWGAPFAAEGYVPEVLLLERTVRWTSSSVAIADERITKVIKGSDAIIQWVNEGAPLGEGSRESVTNPGG